jgi:N-acetylglucosamine repressor
MNTSNRLNQAKTSGSALQAELVRRIRQGWITSRRDVSGVVGIAASTAGDYVTQLVEAGVLIEEKEASGQVGRPTQRLHLNPEAGDFIGVDFECSNLMAQVVDFACQPRYRERRRLTGQVTAAAMERELGSLIQAALGECRAGPLGIGIGVPGLVDAEAGIAVDYPLIHGWRRIPLRDRIEERFGLRVHLDNTGRTGARAEQFFGSGRQLTDFVSLVIRGGVGAGIVEHGQLVTGAMNAAGEVGRWRIPRRGEGRAVTVDEAASVAALCREAGVGGGPSRWGRFEALLREENPEAVAALAAVEEVLGWVLAMLAASLNPSAIILQSILVSLGEPFRQALETRMRAGVSLPADYCPRLIFSDLGFFAGAMGAAAIALEAWEPARKPS